MAQQEFSLLTLATEEVIAYKGCGAQGKMELYTCYLGEEPKAGKGKDQVSQGQNKHEIKT